MIPSATVRLADADYDVVVVGARCAGAATAMLLARAGLRVALVDRAALGRDTLSTHALMRAGVIQLHRWGLLDRVIATGTPAVRRTVFRYGDASTTVTLKAVGGVDALYAPRRTVLDPILVGAAAEAGADLMFGISVTDVERDAGGRAIGILGHDRRRRPVRLRAAVTIGADGLRSTVARAVGAAVERRAAYASASIYAHVSGLETDGYEWLYSPGATAAVIPTNHDQTCVSVGAPQARFRAEFAGDLVASFRRLLAEASPELADRMAAVAAPRRLRGFPGVRGFLRRPWGPGWALVGDAGYYKDPITAHGMLAIPAVIACTDVGDLDRARHYLQVAETSVHLWEGTSWQAAVLEARAHVADAESDPALARGLRAEAAALFDGAGQPLDAARCRASAA